MKILHSTSLVLVLVLILKAYGSEEVQSNLPRNHLGSPVKEQETDRALANPPTTRATTYSSLLTLNVSNTIVVALLAAAGAFYYGGVPFFSIRRSLTGLWDRWDSGFSDAWQSGLTGLWDSGLRDAIQALTPVVQEALRVYSERHS